MKLGSGVLDKVDYSQGDGVLYALIERVDWAMKFGFDVARVAWLGQESAVGNRSRDDLFYWEKDWFDKCREVAAGGAVVAVYVCVLPLFMGYEVARSAIRK